jgi:hypothetical protein
MEKLLIAFALSPLRSSPPSRSPATDFIKERFKELTIKFAIC